jgi:hypothetical protein
MLPSLTALQSAEIGALTRITALPSAEAFFDSIGITE